MPPRANSRIHSSGSPLPYFAPDESPIDSLPKASALASELDRRLFLKTLALPCAAACVMALTRNCFSLPIGTWGTTGEDDSRYRVEARFYEKLPDKMVRCKLCPDRKS